MTMMRVLDESAVDADSGNDLLGAVGRQATGQVERLQAGVVRQHVAHHLGHLDLHIIIVIK